MRRRSVRFRITATSSVLVAVVLVVGGLALVALQRNALIDNLDQGLVQRADDVANALDRGITGELPQSAAEGFVQVVDVQGRVLASSPNLADAPPLSDDHIGPEGESIRNTTGLTVDDDSFRVLSRRLDDGTVIHVGTTFDTVSESAAALIVALAFIVPVLVMALAGLIWVLVGRTLRPVESIRSEVAAIGSADLHRRVPTPGTDDEIDRLAGTMNAMLERLETASAKQQQFVADASHELRSPLTRVRAALELEMAGGKADVTVESARSILGDVLEMQQMVEDLLYLARVDEGQISSRMRELDLDSIVLDECRALSDIVLVDVDTSGVSGAHVVGDASQLTRAIRNILDNAGRHAASLVQIGLSQMNGQAILTVSDDGPGIAESDLERVFERFGRADEARSADTGGTGLGLAIARDVVERHGGSLRAVPNADGARIVMSLPTAD